MVVVAGGKIGVAARISHRSKRENFYLLGAEFDISIDGTRIPPFGAGAIGIGDSTDDARNTAAAEWAVASGECRIDGVVSPALLQAVSKLPWPEGSPGYIFKLFFVGPATGG